MNNDLAIPETEEQTFEICKKRVYDLYEASGKKGKITESKTGLVWASFFGSTFIRLHYDPELFQPDGDLKVRHYGFLPGVTIEFYHDSAEHGITYGLNDSYDINDYFPRVGNVAENWQLLKVHGFPMEAIFGGDDD